MSFYESVHIYRAAMSRIVLIDRGVRAFPRQNRKTLGEDQRDRSLEPLVGVTGAHRKATRPASFHVVDHALGERVRAGWASNLLRGDAHGFMRLGRCAEVRVHQAKRAGLDVVRVPWRRPSCFALTPTASDSAMETAT